MCINLFGRLLAAAHGVVAIDKAAVIALALAGPALAQPFTVTNTLDSGPGSLRDAIAAANAGTGGAISFNIPATDAGFNLPGSPGAWRITALSDLPALSRPIVIEGLSQPGSACGTPKVELRGTPGAATGLVIAADACAIRGLIVNGFSAEGVLLTGVMNSTVACCILGADVGGGTGTVPGNGVGVRIRNGVKCSIGGFDPGNENTIAGNTGIGVSVVVAGSPNNSGNFILRNSIHDNGALGIDLADNGVTPNDNLDLDTGPNHLQNYPAITGYSGGVISGGLSSLANRRFRIELFASTDHDPSNFGEGALFIGFTEVVTSGTGSTSFTLPYAADPGVRYLTATATALPPPTILNGHPGGDGGEAGPFDPRGVAPAPPTGTSEFSQAFLVGPVTNAPPVAQSETVTTPEDADLTITLHATDAENDPLTYRIAGLPAAGQLFQFGGATPIIPNAAVTDAAHRVVFRPPPNANGTPFTAFLFIANDTHNDSNAGTITINVTPVNDPPVAADDAYSTDEDTPLVITDPLLGVLANDSDPDGGVLSTVMLTTTIHGTLVLATNGTFTYTPQADFNGLDSFVYHARNASLTSNEAVVRITVRPVNDPPVAVNDAYSTNEDTPLVVSLRGLGVLANDTDADRPLQTLSTLPGTSTAHGALTLNSDGTFTYTPAPNFNGIDAFTYRATDGLDSSNPATVTLTVRGVNDPPVALDDSYTTSEDTPLTVSAPVMGVLGNDTDVDVPAQILAALLVSSTTHGALSLGSNGTFNYSPAPNYNGPDSFTYRASDGSSTSNLATVSITVTPVNDPPVAVPDMYTTAEDTPRTVTTYAAGVLGNDSDIDLPPQTLTAMLATTVSHGTLSFSANGTFNYNPAPNYNGNDQFTYRASDGIATSPETLVRIVVTPVNDPPRAVNDHYFTDEDVTLDVPAPGVLINDSDIDNDRDTLTVIILTQPAHGVLSNVAGGGFRYVPALNFNSDAGGDDTFTYRLSDGQAQSNIATVAITIRAVNDAPVAVNDAYTTPEDTPLAVPAPGVLANDADADNPPSALTAELVSPPATGALVPHTDGSFLYIPARDFNGVVTFTYRASDGAAVSNTATVTITVTPVNDPPLAVMDVYTTLRNTRLDIPGPAGVLANDTDTDTPHDLLTTALVQPPGHGQLTMHADGGFGYVPESDYTGPDTFTYRASDGEAPSNLATVSITTLGGQNLPPIASDDSYRAVRNGALVVPAAAGVLINDRDPEAQPLMAVQPSPVAHGTLVFQPDGGFTYTPQTDYLGPDSFTYLASDGTLTSNRATVSITVGSDRNLPPVARCRDVTIDARRSCPATFSVTPAQVNNGSTDPDDPVESLLLTLSSTGPFRLGSTPVTLNVADPHGAFSACTANIIVLGEDCNGNGLIDACEIAAGTLPDCNHDGIPDECQCLWTNGMATPASNGLYSQYGGVSKLAGKVADDFYIEPGQVCRITSFSGQMITNLPPALRRARIEFYEDCDGSPSGRPIAAFDNSVVTAVTPSDSGSSLVTFGFDLCGFNLWLDGGKSYWVTLFALATCTDRSESFWATAPVPVVGSVPHTLLGHTAITDCKAVRWDPWLPSACSNMAFKLGGACCPIIWDNGGYWHCPGGGGLISGLYSARTWRTADNFVVQPCADQTVCFLETTIWTNCDPTTGFVEVYENDCNRPGPRLFSAPVSEAIDTGQSIRIGAVDVEAYLLRFYDLNWTLPGGRTYWLSSGATGAGGSIGGRSFFAIADRCETGCDVRISPAWTGRVAVGGQVLWDRNTADAAFRIGATPGARVPGVPVRSVLPPPCPADVNASGAVTVQDLFDFLIAWFSGCP